MDYGEDVAITDQYVATMRGLDLQIVSRATGKCVRCLEVGALASLVTVRGNVVLASPYYNLALWLIDLDLACRMPDDNSDAKPWQLPTANVFPVVGRIIAHPNHPCSSHASPVFSLMKDRVHLTFFTVNVETRRLEPFADGLCYGKYYVSYVECSGMDGNPTLYHAVSADDAATSRTGVAQIVTEKGVCIAEVMGFPGGRIRSIISKDCQTVTLCRNIGESTLQVCTVDLMRTSSPMAPAPQVVSLPDTEVIDFVPSLDPNSTYVNQTVVVYLLPCRCSAHLVLLCADLSAHAFVILDVPHTGATSLRQVRRIPAACRLRRFLTAIVCGRFLLYENPDERIVEMLDWVAGVPVRRICPGRNARTIHVSVDGKALCIVCGDPLSPHCEMLTQFIS